MIRAEFTAAMAALIVRTQSEPKVGTLDVYWREFRDWDREYFETATRECGQDLNRFPTIHQIRERRPKSYSTGVVEESRGWLLKSYKPNDSPETATQLDEITDEELRQVFREGGAGIGVEFSVRMFRQNPNGQIYGKFVRDVLSVD